MSWKLIGVDENSIRDTFQSILEEFGFDGEIFFPVHSNANINKSENINYFNLSFALMKAWTNHSLWLKITIQIIQSYFIIVLFNYQITAWSINIVWASYLMKARS